MAGSGDPARSSARAWGRLRAATRAAGLLLLLCASPLLKSAAGQPDGVAPDSESSTAPAPAQASTLVATPLAPLRPPVSFGMPSPEALSLDRLGRLFVLDRNSSRIDRYDPETESWRSAWAGEQDGARLARLTAIDASSGPDVYALEPARRALHRFDLEGRPRAVIALTTSDGAEAFPPVDFAVTAAGELFLLDREDGRLRLYDRRGRPLADWSDGLAGTLQPRAPTALALNADGTVLMLDPPAGVVRRFARQGTPLSPWRYGAAGRSSDLLAVTPSGLAVVLHDAGDTLSFLTPPDGVCRRAPAPERFDTAPADLVAAGDTLLYLALPHAGRIARWRLEDTAVRDRDDER